MNKESAGIIKSILLLLFLMDAICYTRGQVITPHYGNTDSIKAAIATSTIGDKLRVTIYFRWDKDNIDSTYLTNAQTLHQIDSMMKQKSAEYIDTLLIAAFASPEGKPLYNQKLSERRAEAFRQYLLKTYPRFTPSTVIVQGKGENWDEFHRFAEADPDLPRKADVLSIIDTPNLTLSQRESRLRALDGGHLYKNYLYPKYYPKLRSGASLLIIYNPAMPTDLGKSVVKEFTEPESETKSEPIAETQTSKLLIDAESAKKLNYPIALRTNLLYDAIGAVNVGIEIPIRQHFSIIADCAYSYWRSSHNLYAFQTLEYGIEGRYWFGVNKARNAEWIKSLRGWNVGVYGRYWQRYDIQWIDGVQGDGSWSAGATVGYAFPIARGLTFEPSLGAGYFFTSEYRHYHQPEYDAQNKYHLMWQQTGAWSGLSLTKVRFSLVWLMECKKRGGGR